MVHGRNSLVIFGRGLLLGPSCIPHARAHAHWHGSTSVLAPRPVHVLLNWLVNICSAAVNVVSHVTHSGQSVSGASLTRDPDRQSQKPARITAVSPADHRCCAAGCRPLASQPRCSDPPTTDSVTWTLHSYCATMNKRDTYMTEWQWERKVVITVQ